MRPPERRAGSGAIVPAGITATDGVRRTAAAAWTALCRQASP
jgi:hypothetical protein